MPSVGWSLSFWCPSDYELSEFSGLIEAVGGIHDKLALIGEGHDPFATYDGKRRWNRGSSPESRLVLRRIRYILHLEYQEISADMNISVRGTETIRDALYIVNLVSSWTRDERELFWNTLHLGSDVNNLLDSARKEFESLIRGLEEKYTLSFERLLQYLGPELQALEGNRASFQKGEIEED